MSAPNRLLVLDVGNTNVTCGVFRGRRLEEVWRLETKVLGLERSLARRRGKIGAAVYGSVVPALDRPLEKAVRRACGVRPLRVDSRARLGVSIRVRRPVQVGADRLLNALGAFDRVQGAAIVVDFGTATTFDCVSRGGDYLGGAILPGPNMAARALHEMTAKLPLVSVSRPRRVIGKDTVECLRAGLFFGYWGMIERTLALTAAEMRREGHGRPAVLATGGLCGLFARELRAVGAQPVSDLTLQGLRIAYNRMTSSSRS